MGDLFGGGGDDAADASRDAAQIRADYEREALDYLKEREALPQEYREAALDRLAGGVGIGTGESQEAQIERARNSPLYNAIMGSQQSGEEAILRNASMTGGFRSGNVQDNLYDYNTQLENRALLESYNQQQQQLQGLAGLPSLAPAIAQSTSGIGQTLAQGEIAAAQAQQTGGQQGINNMFGLGQLGLSAYEAFSDIRLKDNIRHIGKKNGHNWYKWDWNQEAYKLGLSGESEGYMAHEIMKVRPDAIKEIDGYIAINMNRLEAA